jgi:hypothetical protein
MLSEQSGLGFKPNGMKADTHLRTKRNGFTPSLQTNSRPPQVTPYMGNVK